MTTEVRNTSVMVRDCDDTCVYPPINSFTRNSNSCSDAPSTMNVKESTGTNSDTGISTSNISGFGRWKKRIPNSQRYTKVTELLYKSHLARYSLLPVYGEEKM